MSKQEPEALRLADMIEQNLAGAGDCEIAAELRRLHDFEEQHRAIDECWIAEIAVVRQQRDALLEALKQVEQHLRWMDHPALDAARAAITKAAT